MNLPGLYTSAWIVGLINLSYDYLLIKAGKAELGEEKMALPWSLKATKYASLQNAEQHILQHGDMITALSTIVLR